MATILGFVFAIVGWPFQNGPTPDPGSGDGPSACEASLSLSRGRGPSGSIVRVSGAGFPPNEEVELLFHTEFLPSARTDSSGAFRARITIPGTFDAFAGQQFQIFAATPTCGDRAQFFLAEPD